MPRDGGLLPVGYRDVGETAWLFADTVALTYDGRG